MQREITEVGELLNNQGELIERGYARELILHYNRHAIKAKSFRIKEWDYYLVANDEYAVALTVADNSYMGLLSVSLIDFKNRWYKTTSVIKPFTFGKLKLPCSSKIGDVEYRDNRIHLAFLNDGKRRKLICEMKKFNKDKDFACEFELYDEPKDSMVIVTPFSEDRKAFYYNQKINCMKAKGMARYDGKEIFFDPAVSMGTLDWGRGVWTYKNTWYWGSASGLIDGVTFGFNIGYGFGDTSAATENMIFYDGKAHKLKDVTFHIPMHGEFYDYMQPWTFTSSDHRFEMAFSPILDREDFTSVGVISSEQHQVFGTFSGIAVLDDGTEVKIHNLLGFAERVYNKW